MTRNSATGRCQICHAHQPRIMYHTLPSRQPGQHGKHGYAQCHTCRPSMSRLPFRPCSHTFFTQNICHAPDSPADVQGQQAEVASEKCNCTAKPPTRTRLARGPRQRCFDLASRRPDTCAASYAFLSESKPGGAVGAVTHFAICPQSLKKNRIPTQSALLEGQGL